MRHDFLDRYSRLESPIHHFPSSVKLFVAISTVITIMAVPFHHPTVYLIILGSLLVISAFSRIPWRFLFGRLLILEPFALGIAFMALFQENGLSIFFAILIKSTLCLLTMIFLSNTTPFSEILTTLQRIKTPPLLVTILALTYRYLFVLIDEGERIQRARSSRTFIAKKRRAWLSPAALIGQLFVRSTERAERIFAAMTSRGWK